MSEHRDRHEDGANDLRELERAREHARLVSRLSLKDLDLLNGSRDVVRAAKELLELPGAEALLADL